MKNIKINWQEPREIAAKIAVNYFENWIFLFSGKESESKKLKSFIAIFPRKQIITDDFLAAEKIIKKSNQKWFGYLAYETSWQFEKMPEVENSVINLAKIWLINFALIIEFDHQKKEVQISFEKQSDLANFFTLIEKENFSPDAKKKAENGFQDIFADKINSNFSDQQYLENIDKIKTEIANGDFFQANLTRKFFGSLNQKVDAIKAFKMFVDLTKLSAANFSSFLKLDDNFIISSSPELFLSAKNKKIISKPIKGTIARSNDKKQDLVNKKFLKNSVKEKAENLMIVDLVRNDLARICSPGSIKVKNLFKINSYSNIHHMSSEVIGKISEKFYAFDALKQCFPAGSMTGAPKIKAMESLAKKEKLARGIYSGAIGIVSKNYLNLAVVIRTLIIREDKFEFQVGGAITFDSNSEAELKEIFSKSKAIENLLKIS